MVENTELVTMNDVIDKMTKDSNGYFWGVFINDLTFYIADKNFNIVFKTLAFNKGNFTDEVIKAMKEYGIDDNKSRMRTEDSIDDLKDTVEREVNIFNLYQKRINNGKQ
jgi:hypothetical protein